MKKNETGKKDYKRAFDEAKSAEKGLNCGYHVTPLDLAHDDQLAFNFISTILPKYFHAGLEFLKKNVEQNELKALVSLFYKIEANLENFAVLYCPKKDLNELLVSLNKSEKDVAILCKKMEEEELSFIFEVTKLRGFFLFNIIEDSNLILTEDFSFLAKDNPIAALSHIIKMCSLARDFLFNRIQTTFDASALDRADAFVAEFLLWVTINYPEFSLSTEQEDLLLMYSQGLKSLSPELSYDSYELPMQDDMNAHHFIHKILGHRLFSMYLQARKNVGGFFSSN